MGILELEPKIQDVLAYQDPPNSRRATSMRECVGIYPDIPPLEYVYRIGDGVSAPESNHAVRNLTTNLPLKVEILFPEYVQVTPGSLIILEPNSETNIKFSVNLNILDDLMYTKQRLFEDKIILSVSMAVSLNGPIYIST